MVSVLLTVAGTGPRTRRSCRISTERGLLPDFTPEGGAVVV